MAVEFGKSGTFYDSPPVHNEIFPAGAADLNVQLGSGFQAAHIWVNNQSNQNLWLEDAPDVVPPGATRVVAIKHTDVAKASWTIPAQFGITQPASPTGSAILIWLNAGIDISPTPGVANNPIVQVSSGTVAISGPVTIGAGSNTIGAISAINATVTVAGTINVA